jgi:hypothetical protein
MRPMVRQRLIAAVGALVVAWASLWPLVSSARLLAAPQPLMLCHPPSPPAQPGEKPEPVSHCPLCLVAFHGGFDTPPQWHVLREASPVMAVTPAVAPPASNPSVRLPPSRAPPADAC